MKQSKALFWLSCLVALLALVAAGIGLFYDDGGSPYTFTSLNGENVQIYGRGLYAGDSFFKAPVFRGTDAVTLFIAVPLLLVGLALYRRGSLRGGIFLTSILSYFLYISVSLAFGAAYNNLFLLYIIFFSASLFAFVLAFRAVDLPTLSARLLPGLPYRGLAIFMFVSGLSVFVWLIEILGGLAAGHVPASLAHYHTDVTAVIDVGIIPPTAYLAGFLLLRRSTLGALLASVMTLLCALIGAVVVSQTVFQLSEGVVLSPGQMVGYAGTFVMLGIFAVGLLVRFFRAITEDVPVPSPVPEPA